MSRNQKSYTVEELLLLNEHREKMRGAQKPMELRGAKSSPAPKVVTTPAKPRAVAPPANPAPAAASQVGLMNADDLLATLFPSPTSRPSARWLRDQAAKGNIPSSKIGGLLFFDVARVRSLLTPGAAPAHADILTMSKGELWAAYGRVLDSQGREAARAFYLKYIEGRA